MALFASLLPAIGGLIARRAPVIGRKFIQRITGGARRAAAPVAVIGAGTAVGEAVFDRFGRPTKRIPSGRRRKGLTAADIRGAQKVARLVQAFGYKPKIKPRKRGR